MNKKLLRAHFPEPGQQEKALMKLMASVGDTVRWIKSRRGLIIGVGILKGGTGKSTETLFFALYCAIVLGLSVCVVDTDDNSQSIGNWYRTHIGLGVAVPFHLEWYDPKGDVSLEKTLKPLRERFDVVIVDLGGGDKNTFIDLCMCGRLLFMPSAPSGWDTSRIQATLRTAARAARMNEEGLTALNHFTRCDFTTTLVDEQRAILSMDRSEADDEFILPPLVHPYFDVSQAPVHVRAFERMPTKRRDLDEYGYLLRHAVQEAMSDESEDGQ